MKKQTLRIAASAATVGVMSIVGFGMVAHAEPNPIKAVGQSFQGIIHRHDGQGPIQNSTLVATGKVNAVLPAAAPVQLPAGKVGGLGQPAKGGNNDDDGGGEDGNA